MNCPKCNCDILTTVDSRKRLNEVYRRRKCEKCGYRFTTSETIVNEHRSRFPVSKAEKTLMRIKKLLEKAEDEHG